MPSKSTLSILEKERKLTQEFQNVKEWEDRYKLIISKGKALASLPENLHTEESKVKGCQSQVWLHASLSEEGRILFQGDSDALIVKGLVAMLLEIYSNSEPAEILSFQPQFITDLGLSSHLSPSRSNGLVAMLKQIHYFATAFQYLTKNKPK